MGYDSYFSMIFLQLLQKFLAPILQLFAKIIAWTPYPLRRGSETLGTRFWDNRWPKRTLYVSRLFGRVLRPQTLMCWRGGHAHFPASRGQTNRNPKLSSITLISHQQSIDNSFLSSHKQFQSNWPKMADLWPINVCPYME